MSTPVKLPDHMVVDAKHYAAIFSRSVPKQIEFWVRIGKMAEENPDLPYEFLKDLMIAQQQLEAGEVSPYEFD